MNLNYPSMMLIGFFIGALSAMIFIWLNIIAGFILSAAVAIVCFSLFLGFMLHQISSAEEEIFNNKNKEE